MDINENNVTKKWAAWPLKSTVKGPDTWYEFTAIFPIDVPIQPNYQIKLFGNSGNKLSYLDDLTITFNY
jgi:hypothetical protein